MRVLPPLAIALVALASARGARELAHDRRHAVPTVAPYAPSAEAASILAIGYREVAADLLFVRLASYFGGGESDPEGVTALVEAIVALDPEFRRIYEFGGRAISRFGVTDQRMLYRAIAVLEAGAKRYPDDWRIPYAAGQIYFVDLETTDPAQRKQWDELGASLIESASRKPGAPAYLASTVSFLYKRLGKREAAINNLREIILVTNDKKAREKLIAELAKLENADASEIAAELFEERNRFETAWKRDRPAINASMYILVGPRPILGFDPSDLASGGRDLAGSEPIERLEPLYDVP